MSIQSFLDCLTRLKEDKPVVQDILAEWLGRQSSSDMSKVSSILRDPDANVAFGSLSVLNRRKLITTGDHVVCSLQSEGGHLDVFSVFCNRAAHLIVNSVFMPEHSRVDMVVKDTKSAPVVFQHLSVVIVVFLTEIFFHLG